MPASFHPDDPVVRMCAEEYARGLNPTQIRQALYDVFGMTVDNRFVRRRLNAAGVELRPCDIRPKIEPSVLYRQHKSGIGVHRLAAVYGLKHQAMYYRVKRAYEIRGEVMPTRQRPIAFTDAQLADLYYHGFSAKNIADMCDSSYGQIRHCLLRARVTFRPSPIRPRSAAT